MINQIYLIFDYDDTIMPSATTKLMQDEPDWGAALVKDRLEIFYRFIIHWKKTTDIPIIIFSAGTIAYVHLVSQFGPYLRISINYFDPAMDVCIFIPIPFYSITDGSKIVKLNNNNMVNNKLYHNTSRYYQKLLSNHQSIEYQSINPSQIQRAYDHAANLHMDKNQKNHVNIYSHKKVCYSKQSVDPNSMTGCFYLPALNCKKEMTLYEFLNCKRQFKNLDALRRHISYVTHKPCKNIRFYFFDDKAIHLGMSDSDIYLSKPHNYSPTYFVGKIIPILKSLTDSHGNCQMGEKVYDCRRRNEIKMLKKLVDKLESTANVVFITKDLLTSPESPRTRNIST